MIKTIFLKILSRIFDFYTVPNSNDITNLGYFCMILVTAALISMYVLGILGFSGLFNSYLPKLIIILSFLIVWICSNLLQKYRYILEPQLKEMTLIPLNILDVFVLIIILMSFPVFIVGVAPALGLMQ